MNADRSLTSTTSGAGRPQAGPTDDPENVAPARSGTKAAFEISARVSITPWLDVDFASAVREILKEVRMSQDIVFGSGAGAVVAQRLLRERGYDHARVIDARDVDQAMRHVARWVVLRDG